MTGRKNYAMRSFSSSSNLPFLTFSHIEKNGSDVLEVRSKHTCRRTYLHSANKIITGNSNTE